MFDFGPKKNSQSPYFSVWGKFSLILNFFANTLTFKKLILKLI